MNGPARQPKVRLIANYLPQFHPFPENDAWHGKGFTEWSNVVRARPLFRGHYQPRIPTELGFYDLRVPEVREQQAELAREHGIEAFCYWHYWFGGRLLMERPLREVLETGRPDFPFCIAWANETWKGVWYGAKGRILMEQTYPGVDDYVAHFNYLLPAFRDPRYLKVDGKPLFMLFRPDDMPKLPELNAVAFVRLWKELALKAGLPGLHIIAYKQDDWPGHQWGFDGATFSHQSIMRWLYRDHRVRPFIRRLLGRPVHVYDFAEAARYMHGPKYPDHPVRDDHYPSIVAGWDNSPRCNDDATILHNMTPEAFRAHVRNVIGRVMHKPLERRIVFVKSWNEWAESNYLEPDLRYGRAFLEVLRDEVLADSNAECGVRNAEFTTNASPDARDTAHVTA